jgi:CDP-2,3-bis-(O-geranylgeranyl)-sn-glycerol synthase
MRGFLFGIGGGIFISLCQFILAKGNFTVSNEVLDYTNLGQSLSFGLLMSTGSLLGDAIESTIKRQLNIAPGESLIIADQIDYVIGAVLITFPFFTIPLITIGSFIVLAFALYLFSGIFSKVVGMKRKWI